MSNFTFLPSDFRDIPESAAKAEGHIMGDPRAACFRGEPSKNAVAGPIGNRELSIVD